MKTRFLLLASSAFLALQALAGVPEGFDTDTKWYTTFTSASNEFEWPAGSVYGSAVSFKNNGTTANPVFGVYSNTDPDDFTGFFITPKLRAAAGEKLIIESRCNSAYSDADGINVYISATREGLSEPAARTPILKLAAASTDEATKLTTTVQQFETSIPEAGEYYIGFSSYNRGQINGVYGCELVEVAHDLSISMGNFPATAVQNNDAVGYVNILNYGIKDEKASDYTVVIDVDGKTTVLSGEKDIVSEHSLSATGVAVPVKFRSPKVGTVTVKVSVEMADGFSLQGDPVEVSIVKETLNAELVVGETGKTSSSVPFAGMYDNSETLSLYTPEMLGLKKGDKVKSISVNGYVSGNAVGTESHMKLCYAWSDLTTLEKPDASAAYDASNMTAAFDDKYQWTEIGSADNLKPILVMNFDEPLVYEEGKSLLLLFHNERDKYKSGIYLECASSNAKTSWTQKADNPYGGTQTGVFKGNWSNVETPTIHLTLDVTPRSISGNITAANDKVKDAVITLVSTDGDDIEYEGTSDEEGNFTVDVIQSDRKYDLSILADGFAEYVKDLSFSESSIERDFKLRRIVKISDDGCHVGGDENAIVYLDKVLTPGFNVISLPIALTAGEFKEVFGEDAKVYSYTSDKNNPGVVAVNFVDYNDDLEAGRPYLIKVSVDSVSGHWEKRKAVEALQDVDGSYVVLKSTSESIEVSEGVITITEDNFFDYPEEGSGDIDPQNGDNPMLVKSPMDEEGDTDDDTSKTLPAYSGYLEAKANANGKILVTFNGKNIDTGVENITVNEIEDTRIYNLQGLPIEKPTRGIYVVNGRLVILN